jgi:hypothetical protein
MPVMLFDKWSLTRIFLAKISRMSEPSGRVAPSGTQLEPVVVKAGGGWRWLAMTPYSTDYLEIAVLGGSEGEARRRYAERLETWSRLLRETASAVPAS